MNTGRWWQVETQSTQEVPYVLRRITLIAALTCAAMPAWSGGTARAEQWAPMGLEDSEARCVAVSPSDADVILVGGEFLHSSQDGGISWLTEPSATQINSLAFGSNSNVAYAGGWGSGIWFSNDSGVTWSARSAGLGNYVIKALAVSPVDDALVFAGAEDGIYRSTDGGLLWTRMQPGINIGAIAICESEASLIYAGTWQEGLWVSDDTGVTWSLLDTVGLPTDASCWSLAVEQGECAVVYATYQGGGVWRSLDQGISWSQISPAFEGFSVALDPSRPGFVYGVGGWSSPQRSGCYGALYGWRGMDNGWAPGWFARGITVAPTVPGLVYACGTAGGLLRWVSDTTEPSPASDLVASGGPGAIGLEWIASDSDDCAGYWIYRWEDGTDVPRTPLASVSDPLATSFSDTSAEIGITYAYAVAAADSAENSSVWTNVAAGELNPSPDLTITEPQTPASGVAGNAAEVSWSIANTGSEPADGPWTDRLYVSPDAVFDDGNDVLLEEWTFPGGHTLSAGEFYERLWEGTLSVTPGEYWYIIVTDALDAVAEEDGEANNVWVAEESTTVYATPPDPARSLLVGGAKSNSVVRRDAAAGEISEFVPGFAGMHNPMCAVIGPDGAVYVTTGVRVLRYHATTGEFIDIFVDGEYSGVSSARGLCFGPDGHLYVSSYMANEVLRYDGQTGAFIDVFISAGLGDLGFPGHLVFGPDGHLYVCSTNEVLRYDGQTGEFMGAFVTAGSGGLDGPSGLLFGTDGFLYVASVFNDSVIRYDAATGAFADVFVTTQAGGLGAPTSLKHGPDTNLYVASLYTDSVLCYEGNTGEVIGEFVPAGSGGLSFPIDLLFVDNRLLVLSLLNSQILQYDATTGEFEGRFAGGGSGGLILPKGLVYGPDDDLYVASGQTHEVLRYDGRSGTFLGSFVPAGYGGLDTPRGLAFGPDGHFYVVSRGNASILRYDEETGAFIDEFVASGTGGMVAPQDMVFHSDGLLYVSDYQTDSVHRFDADTGAYVGEFIEPGAGGLDYPIGLAAGPDGNWYVPGNYSDSVLRFSGVDGSFMGEFVPPGSGGLDQPQGITFDTYGNLYISAYDVNNVLRFDGATGDFLDEYVPSEAAGLAGPQRMVWMPDFGVYGDMDGDDDIDIDDFVILGDCLFGPGAVPGCDPGQGALSDMDGDEDVDLADFAAFQRVFGE